MRLLVFALDGAPYDVFSRLFDELPNIAELRDGGRWGTLRAVDPPITVPAWASMFTGKDPGELGIYGFRHLKRGTYEGYVVTSQNLKERFFWESEGLRSIVIGLPPGYPPRRYGIWISDFYTPDTNRQWTYPPSIAGEITGSVGDYVFDVPYRTDRKEEAYRALVDMTLKRWRAARMLMEKYPWDVFVLHEIGTDRLHHLYQKYFDPEHPQYVPGSPYEAYLEEYYRLVDGLVGDLVKTAKRRWGDGVAIAVLSDHGNQAQRGVFAINMWLADEGYLHFRSEPARGEDIERADVDWKRTQLWAWGGYYARIFVNKAGREPQGIVTEEEYWDLLHDFKRKVRTLKCPWGHVESQVYRPQELYRAVNGDYPDLIVYLDKVRVRPVQTLGYETYWLSENDRGPDDSLHSFDGIYILNPHEPGKRDMYAVDVAAALTELMRKR